MNIMKGCGLLRSSHRKLAAVLVSILLILSFTSMALLVSAAENSVSLTLYNDSISASAGSTASYTWKMTENVSNVFRLVVDMDLAQTYKAGELELTINAFDGAGRNTTITRKSFGNETETGVFKETSADSSGKIVAVNTAAVNGSASISVTYQFKPEDIKDLGTVNKPLTLQCTLKAGKSTVTSNAITFSTDFTQAWSIINSGEHDEAYDEIEVYKPNDSAPLIHNANGYCKLTIQKTGSDSADVNQSHVFYIRNEDHAQYEDNEYPQDSECWVIDKYDQTQIREDLRCPNDVDMNVIVHGNESVTVILPAGTYTVMEDDSSYQSTYGGWSWRYYADASEQEVTLDANTSEATLVFNNERVNDQGLSGGSWLVNEFTGNGLVRKPQ